MPERLLPDYAPSSLIIGLPYAGKTTLVAELRRREKLAFDGDGLGDWYDEHGTRQPYQDDKEWRARHRYLWDLRMLAKLVLSRPKESPLYVAGVSQNMQRAFTIFDNVIALEVDASILTDRAFFMIGAPHRNNPYPVSFEDYSSEGIVNYATTVREQAEQYTEGIRRLGLRAIDGTQGIKEIADEVVAITER